jgi:hypothetical protein
VRVERELEEKERRERVREYIEIDNNMIGGKRNPVIDIDIDFEKEKMKIAYRDDKHRGRIVSDEYV